MTWRESFEAAGGMLRLGLAFMWSALLVALVAYVSRMIIAREIDLIAVGIFSAAFALSGMVVNFVLSAMGADYYPSLTAVNHDHTKMRELVNRQTEIGLLLALPGLLATLALAPWVIRIFYSAEFAASSELLQWFALGCLGRVISWPMGFIILAKGYSRLFAATETVCNGAHLALIWLGLTFFGLEGVAVAFALLYILYTVFMIHLSNRLIGYAWSPSVWRLLSILVPVVVATFLAVRTFPLWPATILGAMVSVVTGVCCLFGLIDRVGTQHRIIAFLFKRIPLLEAAYAKICFR